jgi:hypothetical protein
MLFSGETMKLCEKWTRMALLVSYIFLTGWKFEFENWKKWPFSGP